MASENSLRKHAHIGVIRGVKEKGIDESDWLIHGPSPYCSLLITIKLQISTTSLQSSDRKETEQLAPHIWRPSKRLIKTKTPGSGGLNDRSTTRPQFKW